jgi:hypothetical protein
MKGPAAVEEEQPDPSPSGHADRARWSGWALLAVGVSLLLGTVLRWWGLGTPGLSFDESFTAAYASLPVGRIPEALAANDTHPPLDYLLRHVVAGTGSDAWLRMPSAVVTTGALLLTAWWMRRRGWFGVAVVAFTSLSAFQVLHAHQARMYGLMVLFGVMVAVLAEDWLLGRRPRRVEWAVAGVLLLGTLTHAGGLFLVAGAMSVPLLRRDGEAWRWRVAVLAPLVVWAIVWGPSFARQLERGGPSWVPLTTPGGVAEVVRAFVTNVSGSAVVVVGLVAVGAWCLRSLDRVLFRVWASLFLVPLVIVVVAGLWFHVLLTRTLAAASWAVPVALAALVVAAFRRSAPIGALAGVLVVVVSVWSLPFAATFDEGTAEPVEAAVARAEPGDAVAVHPRWLWPVLWTGAGSARSTELVDGLDPGSTFVWIRPGRPFSGRVWLLQPSSYALDGAAEWARCDGDRVRVGDWTLDCVVPPRS